MTTKEILAQKIRQLRSLQGKSQMEFAEDIGIGKTELGKIENAQANPTLDTLEQFAGKFHVPVSSLLAEEEDANTMVTARVLLSSLKAIEKLEPEKQTQALQLFERLLSILRPGMER